MKPLALMVPLFLATTSAGYSQEVGSAAAARVLAGIQEREREAKRHWREDKRLHAVKPQADLPQPSQERSIPLGKLSKDAVGNCLNIGGLKLGASPTKLM